MPEHYNGNGMEITMLYQFTFTNKETGQQIKMLVPRSGVFHDKKRRLTTNDAGRLARKVRDIIRKELD